MEVFTVENNEPEPFDNEAALDAKIAVCHEQLADLADAEKKLKGHRVLRWFAIFREVIESVEKKLVEAKRGVKMIEGMSLEEINEKLEMVCDQTSPRYTGATANKFRVLQLKFAASKLEVRPSKRTKLNN